MTNENEELFKSIEDEEIKQDEQENIEIEEVDELEDFTPSFRKKSPNEVKEDLGVKEKADGRVLTVKSVSATKPRTYTLKDGVKVSIDPTVSPNTGTKYYSGKLKVKFEEDNLVEYYPGINYFFKNDGSINEQITLNRKGDNQVSNLVRRILLKMAEAKGLKFETKKTRNGIGISSKDAKSFGEFSATVKDEDIVNFLIGKKVKIETEEGVYLGKNWFRNNIVEIL